jgi:hypothetical protein
MGIELAMKRSMLTYRFGLLMYPVVELAQRAQPPKRDEYRIVAAKLRQDLNEFGSQISDYATIKGIKFNHEAGQIHSPSLQVEHLLSQIGSHPEKSDTERQVWLKTLLDGYVKQTHEAINSIPIEWEAELFEAKTPFATALALLNVMQTVKTRLHYYDRYLNSDFFHFYLRNIPRAIDVRVVTTPGNATYGVQNVEPFARLAAKEFASFALIQCDPKDMHDRNLVVDDTVFSLGASLKDAGIHPTNFSPGDSSLAGRSLLDQVAAGGTVIVSS